MFKRWVTTLLATAIIAGGAVLAVSADETAQQEQPTFAVAIHESGQLIVLYVVHADGRVHKFDASSGVPAEVALALGNTARVKEGFDTSRACGVNALGRKII